MIDSALYTAAHGYQHARKTFAEEINNAISALHEQGVAANPGSTEPLWKALVTTPEGYRDHALTALIVLLDITAGYYSTARDAHEEWKEFALNALTLFDQLGKSISKTDMIAVMVASLSMQFPEYKHHQATVIVTGWWQWFANKHPEFAASDTDVPPRATRGARS